MSWVMGIFSREAPNWCSKNMETKVLGGVRTFSRLTGAITCPLASRALLAELAQSYPVWRRKVRDCSMVRLAPKLPSPWSSSIIVHVDQVEGIL